MIVVGFGGMKLLHESMKFELQQPFPIILSHGSLHASCCMWVELPHPYPVTSPHCQISIL